MIGSPEELLTGPRRAYNLDFDLEAARLPGGRVRFSFHGDDLDSLLQNQKLDLKPEMVTELRCMRTTSAGRVVDHPSNQRWILRLKIDEATKNAVVGMRIMIPRVCVGCGVRIRSEKKVHVCQSCEDFGLCQDCFDEDKKQNADHIFETVRLD